ncbi:MAG TPA: phosphatase PAP2 family protein [Anaerolineaceae bacterium]|nr:phosphatase PAP2 family protein [Anaerolineaceae bacterium]
MDALIDFEILFTLFWQNLGSWLEYPMQAFTFLGSELFFLLVMPALYWSIDPVIGFRAGMMLILSGGLNSIFKIFFHTPRPFWIDSDVRAFASETSFGMPSGHSQNSAAIWGVIAGTIRRKWAYIVAILLVFFIGLSRIYLGVHFLHDVLTGWLAGILIILAYLKLEKPVAGWLERKSISAQILISFLFAVSFIFFGYLAQLSAGNWKLPPEWTSLALTAGAEAPDPFNLEGVITIAGVAFGFTAGYAWWRNRYGIYEIKCSSIKKLARYTFGLLGIVALYFGLSIIFPEEPLLVAAVFRFLRYTLIGLWVTVFAPLFFRLFHLDR